MKEINLSERQIKLYITKIYKQIIKDDIKFTKVVGIENGGLHVSEPLAKRLGLPHCSIKISFYGDNKEPAETPVVDLHGVEFDKDDYLLVCDDILDSGKTFKYWKDTFSLNHKVATLIWNPLGKYNVAPDYFARYKPLDSWIVFPWKE